MKNTEFEESKLNADQTNNANSGNEQLFTTSDIENTPFTWVEDDRMGGTFIAYGNNIITEIAKTETEIDKLNNIANKLSEIPWEVLLNAMGVLIDYKLQEKK